MKGKTKRVLHVVGGMSRAGTETMLMNLYRNIDTENLQFDFITFYENESDYYNEIIKRGGKIIILDRPEEIGRFRSLIQMIKVIRDNGPYQAIHGHTQFNCGVVVLAGYISNVKVRISHAHTNIDHSNGIIRRIYVDIMRIIINLLSTNLLSCSKSAGKYLFGNIGIKSKKYKYIPNYIHYEDFINFKYRKECNNDDREMLIGHIGRFEEVKNHDFLIDVLFEILKINSNVRLISVGDGNLFDKIKKKSEKLGITDNISFLGIREDIPSILNKIDIFLLPSKYEGLGLVLLEAQAAGKKCIVSDVIQDEADLGLGLLEKVSLNESPSIWAKIVLKNLNYSSPSDEEIKYAFKNNGYDFDYIIGELLSIYNIK